ncbi:MAG: hypothetical protein AAF371_05000 [Pseudomonadota bacterium]
MLWKIAFTTAVIAVVFLLGQRSMLGRGAVDEVKRRVPRQRRLKRRADAKPRSSGQPEPFTDLVRCPDCGNYHGATVRCACRS